MNPEQHRLEEARAQGVPWRKWGPYLSERQWGTVREDYSENGDAWNFFTHDHARSRAYRWGEDGIAGISDDKQGLCFALALWNGKDPILKERLFGLTNSEGNHGEDVKEYYFYLDSTPTHSYMKCLYKYPQAAYPYADLVETNRRRTRSDMEYELLDTGVFKGDRYFDVFVEYAKAGPEEILLQITAANRGPDAAELHLLPTLWFRNDWASWIAASNRAVEKPRIEQIKAAAGTSAVAATHSRLGEYILVCDGEAPLLFTENETNNRRLFPSQPDIAPYVKDGINNCVVQGDQGAVNPDKQGTKVAAHYRLTVGPGQSATVRLRLIGQAAAATSGKTKTAPSCFGQEFDKILAARLEEADEFYRSVTPPSVSPDAANVMRQALAGMLWSKQFFFFDGDNWLDEHHSNPLHHGYRYGRNSDWFHMLNEDIISMPDKWEYPWFAAWDTAFHCVAFALIDADFAKEQLILLTREWYMHPNGQIPAYEWAFGDVNPPVHAWAAIRICQIEQKMTGRMDRVFLERIFRKLLINFTWWVNRKDAQGNNLFEGGFLGLDNIGAFDRSAGLPAGGELEQADGTSWMAMYCLNMLTIALVLAREDTTYEDVATKFFEHFVYIGEAVNRVDGHRHGLWDEAQGYYFDALLLPDGRRVAVEAFTIAGLVPLFAIAVADQEVFAAFKDFSERYRWFAENRPELLGNLADLTHIGVHERIRLALVDSHKLARILEHVLDERHMLSANGIRSVSRRHAYQPLRLTIDGQTFTLDYEPAESTSGLFGGNSNWRGPVWFPLNFLVIEALQQHHYFLGDDFKVSDPAGSERACTLWQVASELSQRLTNLFARDASGRRPAHGRHEKFRTDP
ncbi:MAG: glucosidase, partial [Kofleriaceae bacterium]|nr:glucosidase [Candidatus Methylomirabilis lanthanidiphila]